MIKRLFILAMPLFVAGCVTDGSTDPGTSSSTSSSTGDLSDNALKGRDFAQANCAGCHALDDGVSPNPNAPSLRRAAHRLPDWAVAGSFRRGVQVGHSMEMPVFVFEDDDVTNLLAYFEALKQRDLAPDAS